MVQDYVLGSALQNDYLVSFTYDSENTSFTDNPTYDQTTGASSIFADTLSGSIKQAGGFYNIHVAQNSVGVPTNSFDGDTNGIWSVTSNSPVSDGDVTLKEAIAEDSGSDGKWNGGAVSAAPEPSTWALMLGGVGIVGGMLRLAVARRREDLAAA